MWNMKNLENLKWEVYWENLLETVEKHILGFDFNPEELKIITKFYLYIKTKRDEKLEADIITDSMPTLPGVKVKYN